MPALGFKARIFVALVGISSVTSLIIGLVLYYFAQDRLVEAENTLLEQRSRTANAGAQDFLEGLRNPEDQTSLPPTPTRMSWCRRWPTRQASRCSTSGLRASLAARDGFGDPRTPGKHTTLWASARRRSRRWPDQAGVRAVW